jgi:undecaprenyl-diphosphatase
MINTFMQWDARASEKLRMTPRGHIFWYAAVFFAHSGDSWFWAVGLLFLWFFGNSAWHNLAMLLVIGICFQIVVVFTLKFSVRRSRPQGEWGAIYRNTDPHSFPSGHATRAILLAVMALGLGPAWFGILLAVWAPLVCLARVSTGVHYVSDVLAGAIIGALIGALMLPLTPLWHRLFPILFRVIHPLW